MRNKLVLFLTLSLYWGGAVLMNSSCFAQEQITVTTYYPSPYGSYNELRSKMMAIGDNYLQMSQVCWGAGCATVIPAATDLIVEGDVGIGTTAPAAKLDVNGGVRIGSVIAACDAANQGTVRYNANKMEYCNGVTWVTLSDTGPCIWKACAQCTGQCTCAAGRVQAGTQTSYDLAGCNGVWVSAIYCCG